MLPVRRQSLGLLLSVAMWVGQALSSWSLDHPRLEGCCLEPLVTAQDVPLCREVCGVLWE